MPEQSQSKYMNLNEFLETFFAAQDAHEDHIGYFPNMIQENNDLTKLRDYIKDVAQNLRPNTRKLFEQYWNARNDNSPAAADFLNMVNAITVWYADRAERHSNLTNSYNAIKYIIQNGKITNQDFALRLLKIIEATAKDPKLKLEIKRLIAINPAAHPFDVYRYSAAVVEAQSENRPYDKGAPEELMKILNDQMVTTDANIDKELGKDVPSIDAIEKMGGINLISIAENILRLVEYQVKYGGRNSSDSDEIREIIALLQDKYNMDNILGLNKKPYGPEYEKQASLKLAKMEPEYKKMEYDLGIAQKSQREMREAYDSQTRQIRELQDRIQKLESQMDKEKSKNALRDAIISVFIREAKDRANGKLFRVRPDMQKLIQKFKDELEQGRVSI